MIRASILAAVCAACLLAQATMLPAADWLWAKGNLHTHTTVSDGDSSPQAVADWYREHGYQFLVITDHNELCDVAPITGQGDGFVLIPGEEIGKWPPSAIHVNAIGIDRKLEPIVSVDWTGIVLDTLKLVREAGGVPMINHPNGGPVPEYLHLKSIHGPYLLEIANMSSGANNSGDLARISTEQLWDHLLSAGHKVYATATDDMHALANSPGRGWVVAKVRKVNREQVTEALSKGRFYASTGVVLSNCDFNGRTLSVKVKPVNNELYTIRFLGKWGSPLDEVDGSSASYTLPEGAQSGDYVRCKVISSSGTVAWTQAFRIGAGD